MVNITKIISLLNSINSKLTCITETIEPLVPSVEQIGILIDGGDSEITTGFKGRFRVPYDGNIVKWTILEVSEVPVVSSIEVDMSKGDFDTYPTFTSITGGDFVKIDNDIKGEDFSLTNWTIPVLAGDLFEWEVMTVTDAVKVMVFIDIQRT